MKNFHQFIMGGEEALREAFKPMKVGKSMSFSMSGTLRHVGVLKINAWISSEMT